ncbi:class I SAM-dependent methyltransferase [Candidatus Lokiarchaeum ossiferum]
MNPKESNWQEPSKWEEIAAEWISFNESGKNIHRDFLNLPRFVEALPSLEIGMKGLEVGCGEGMLARKILTDGINLDACDISPVMINHARKKESQESHHITYFVENAEHLSFPENSYDFILAFMCLMDMDHPEKAIQEAYRVLKPGGFFQFSIVHPCFASSSHRKHVRDANGVSKAIEIGNYTSEGKVVVNWNNGSLKGTQTFHNHKMLTTWMMYGINAGFILEFLDEPFANSEILQKCEHLVHTISVPDNLIVRLRKPL